MKFHTDIVLEEWATLRKILQTNGGAVQLDGKSLTLAEISAIARYHSSVSIDTKAEQDTDRSLQAFRSRLAAGDIIYGVNTGFGGTADVRNAQAQNLQRVLIRELHYGILGPSSRDPTLNQKDPSAQSPFKWNLPEEQHTHATHLPETWTRASIVVRLNSLLKGTSAVRPVVLRRMIDLLAHDIVPVIPLRGSISASGDLSPLSYIAGAIQGKSTIRIHSHRGNDEAFADTAFAKTGLEPVVLEAKEGLAIVNGTATSAASAAIVLHDAHNLALLSQIVTAMSVEALTGTLESFDPFFSQVRPHPGQIEAARNIRRFLAGSQLVQVNDGADSALRQDRYSIRTAPQWIGPVLEDLVLAHQQISIECNSATDNPLIDAEGKVLHGGNFQAKAVTSAMEKTRQGNCSLSRMLFAQCVEIINPATSRGLPPNLVAENPGTSFIFKGTDINMAALQAEMGFLAAPVNHVQTAEMGNQSLNSLALISARYTSVSNDVFAQMIAVHVLALCQALDLRVLKMQVFQSFIGDFKNLVQQLYAQVNSNVKSEEHMQGLSQKLWKQLVASFDATVSMDAEDRFAHMANALRPVFLDDDVFSTSSDLVASLKSFCSSLSDTLLTTWIAHRDAYIVHGDATPFLGHGSKHMYGFVRKTLGIPFLCTRQLLTPRTDGPVKTAPTVGSFNSIMYRAIKDGSVMGTLMDMLSEEKVKSML